MKNTLKEQKTHQRTTSKNNCTVIMNNKLSDLLLKYSNLKLECDGLTRVLSYVLTENGIPHEVATGTLYGPEGEVVHWWIILPDGRYIDYRAQMWQGKSENIPNGIFNAVDYPDVTYVVQQRGKMEVPKYIFKILTQTLTSPN